MSRLFPAHAPEWLHPALGVDAGKVQEHLIRHLPAARRRRESAVLVLLKGTSFEDGEVLLTHRSPSMRSHSGQIAFPGGRKDEEDTSLVDAALREAEEETGLDRSTVTPLEQWGKLDIPATGNTVSPVLAYWHKPGTVWSASPEETDDVFTVPLQELADPANRLMVGFSRWKGPAFRTRGYLVWGFTAGVLSGLMDHAGWSVEWDKNLVHDLRDSLDRSSNNEKIG